LERGGPEHEGSDTLTTRTSKGSSKAVSGTGSPEIHKATRIAAPGQPTDSQMLMVYVSRDMHERLHELRRATGRSMSEHVRRALDEYLAR